MSDSGVLKVVEVLANPATGEVALLAPNGHPVDPHPWLCITPNLCDGGAEGYSWESDEYVFGWTAVDHGGVS